MNCLCCYCSNSSDWCFSRFVF